MRIKRRTCSEGCIGGPPQYGGHHPGCPNAPSELLWEKEEEMPDNEWTDGYKHGLKDGQETTSMQKLETLVDRFLSWPVPTSVCPDNLDADRRMRPGSSGTKLSEF